MLCPLCHAPNREDAKFCKTCGQFLRIEPASAVITPQKSAISAPSELGQTEVTASEQQPAVTEMPPELMEDPALAPTLILSPDKVMAYRSRFWKMSEKEAAPMHPADFPTLIEPRGDVPTLSASEGVADSLADAPTIIASPTSEDLNPTDPEQPAFSANQQEFSPAPRLDFAPATGENAEHKEVNQAMTDQPVHDAGAPQAEGQETIAPSAGEISEFSLLAVGDTLIERYEITQILSEGSQEHTYQIIDRLGYQHCWNCGSEENAQGGEFCDNCGASMLNVPYILHEYPASTGSSLADETTFQGSIIHTFMDRSRTYAVEQPSLNQSSFANGIQLLAACNSDAGDVRRSEPNEDSALVLQLQRVHESNTTPAGIFIVADGLGGHDSGQVASRIAINIIAERMVRELLSAPLQAEREGQPVKSAQEDDLVGLLRNTIEEANQALCQKNQREKTDMGSTLTGYMIVGENAYIVNVGDSRTYMVRGGQIYQLTTDHSLVGQLVAGGLIEPDDVYSHPQRSQIFRSLGDKPNVQVDVFKQQLLPGDILLSCSDGLWEMVRNPQIESILNNAPDPQTACTQLIDAANTNGGEDNVSAAIVFVR
jgi:serine/threonine protein phosphatase PrpC